MKLSILIPTTPDRQSTLDLLLKQLDAQSESVVVTSRETSGDFTKLKTIIYTDFQIIICEDNRQLSIGTKRNLLLKGLRTDYVAFIDSDDRISDNYIKLVMEGIANQVDCCSLRGIIKTDGANPLIFEHSIKYDRYATTENLITYERYPNHLNCISYSIAKQFKFPETNHGEDTDWATQIHKSGLIKTEHYIPEVIYYYDYKTKK